MEFNVGGGCLGDGGAQDGTEEGEGATRAGAGVGAGAGASRRHAEPAKAWVTTRKPRKPAGAWLTAVKLHRGSLYACQYQKQGVLEFDGDSLQYRRVVASGARLITPEGLAFARGHMFVTSAEGGRIVAYDMVTGHEKASATFRDEELASEDVGEDGSDGKDMVPWGMTVGPDGALYVAVDRSYVPVDDNYAVPPPLCASCGEMHRSGAIVRVELLLGGGDGEKESEEGNAEEEEEEDDDDDDDGEGSGDVVVGAGTAGGTAVSGGKGAKGKEKSTIKGKGKETGGGLRFGAMTNFCEGLSRPSGLTFTEGGELLVASLDLQVSRFAGPASPTPGRYLGVFYSLIRRNNTPRRIKARKENALGYHATCPDLQSFDVLATRHQGGRVYISIHSGLGKRDPRLRLDGQSESESEMREDGLVVCNKSGREIGFIQDDGFEHANMLTGE